MTLKSELSCSVVMKRYVTFCTESIAYEFGPNRGLITYVFPEDRRPEMKSDVLALGFVTTKEDAVLLRVDSGTSNDYMELEIVSMEVVRKTLLNGTTVDICSAKKCFF